MKSIYMDTKIEILKECIEEVESQMSYIGDYRNELLEDGCDVSEEDAQLRFGNDIKQSLKNKLDETKRVYSIMLGTEK